MFRPRWAGQVYSVSSNGMLLGSTTIDAFGDGKMTAGNDNLVPLPAGVTTSCSAMAITVNDAAGALILSGSF